MKKRLSMAVLALTLLVGMFTMSAAAAVTADVTFTFTDEGITISDPHDHGGYEIEGTGLTINAEGTYTVTGSCADGSITVKKETTGVNLILDDLTLTSSTGAPISCNKSTEVTLTLSGTSTLTDAEDPADEESTDTAVADAFDGAVIKVKSGGSLTVTGDGTLNADGSGCKNGIKGGAAAITVESGTINISAANNGLACNNEVIVKGGKLSITAGNDAVKAEPDEDDTESKGNVTITGGEVTIQCEGDGIQASADLTITGGSFTMTCGDDAITAELVTTIGTEGSSTGPEITVLSCEEGIEGGKVYLHSGSATITAKDDGVNAANDVDNYQMLISITGGKWYINSDGDGLDAGGNATNNSGGDILISGGETQVFGAANDGNSAIDYDGTMTHTGGTLLAVGMGGMNQMPSSGTYVVFGQSGVGGGFGGMLSGFFGGGTSGSVSIQKGSAIAILDESGNPLYTATGVKSANQVLFMSDQLTAGTTYTLQVNGSDAATATASTGSGLGGMQPGQQPGGDPGQGGTPPTGDPGQGMPPPTGDPHQGGQQPQQPNTGVLPFTDVKTTDWYYNAVLYAYQNGVMQGMDSTTFSPDTNLTRAQMVQILYNIEGKPAVTGASFLDVKRDAWYADAVAWAQKNGIVTGYDAFSFGPDDTLTRAQAATILMRYAAYKGMNVDASAALTFSDAENVPDWAADAMQWCAAKGLLQGDDNHNLLPNGTATRAQIATIMQRYLTAA